MPPREEPEAPAHTPFRGREHVLFQDALERLLAPDLGPLRHRTREIVDWILEAYLSPSLPEKVQAYTAARQAAREAAEWLGGPAPGAGAMGAERRARLLQDLVRLDRALVRMLELIRLGRRP